MVTNLGTDVNWWGKGSRELSRVMKMLVLFEVEVIMKQL